MKHRRDVRGKTVYQSSGNRNAIVEGKVGSHHRDQCILRARLRTYLMEDEIMRQEVLRRRIFGMGLAMLVGIFLLIKLIGPAHTAPTDDCLVYVSEGTPIAAYDMDTGFRWDYDNSWRRPVNLREISHNGRYVAYLKPIKFGADNYWLVGDDIISGRRLFTLPNAAYRQLDITSPDYAVIWSPDDKYFVYQIQSGAAEDLTIYSYDGSLVGKLNMRHGDVAWSPDSKIVAAIEYPYSDARDQNDTHLHFWFPVQNKDVVFPIDRRKTQATANLAWSPTADVVATFIRDLNRNGPVSLALITPTQKIIIWIGTQSDAQSPGVMSWSSNG